MKRTMILGGHTAVICVRNARCWDMTVEAGGVDEVTHLLLYICHFILVHVLRSCV